MKFDWVTVNILYVLCWSYWSFSLWNLNFLHTPPPFLSGVFFSSFLSERTWCTHIFGYIWQTTYTQSVFVSTRNLCPQPYLFTGGSRHHRFEIFRLSPISFITVCIQVQTRSLMILLQQNKKKWESGGKYHVRTMMHSKSIKLPTQHTSCASSLQHNTHHVSSRLFRNESAIHSNSCLLWIDEVKAKDETVCWNQTRTLEKKKKKIVSLQGKNTRICQQKRAVCAEQQVSSARPPSHWNQRTVRLPTLISFDLRVGNRTVLWFQREGGDKIHLWEEKPVQEFCSVHARSPFKCYIQDLGITWTDSWACVTRAQYSSVYRHLHIPTPSDR
jgi:hypothetical protein